MANHSTNTVAMSCSSVVLAAIGGELGMMCGALEMICGALGVRNTAGFGVLVVVNDVITSGQGTEGLFSIWPEVVPVDGVGSGGSGVNDVLELRPDRLNIKLISLFYTST
jgi:hypothetical protein